MVGPKSGEGLHQAMIDEITVTKRFSVRGMGGALTKPLEELGSFFDSLTAATEEAMADHSIKRIISIEVEPGAMGSSGIIVFYDLIIKGQAGPFYPE